MISIILLIVQCSKWSSITLYITIYYIINAWKVTMQCTVEQQNLDTMGPSPYHSLANNYCHFHTESWCFRTGCTQIYP